MAQQIETVGVLGAGVMGAQLAGHLANMGVPSLLFDVSQELAEKAITNLTTLKPAPLYQPGNAKLITPCNYDEHLQRLTTADWVLEAVVERLDIKHQVRIMNHVERQVRNEGRCAMVALHDVNLAARYCSHILMLSGEGNWQAGLADELLEPGNLEKLYQCPVEAVETSSGIRFLPGS